jgi:cell division protein ZipA
MPLEPGRPAREPSLGAADIRQGGTRHELPVIEIEDEPSELGLRIDGRRVEAEPDPVLDSEPILETRPDAPSRAVETPAEPPAVAPQPPPLGAPVLPATGPVREPVVELPPEQERRVLALRIVSPATGERFAGRTVRLALAAAGFVHGKFSIFHHAGSDGRVVMSAASLTKPGTFDVGTMDTQRYTGLNLFAVLPGPMPAAKTFDTLLETAHLLAERLRGSVLDDRGQPITAQRAAELRAAAAAPATGPDA